MPGPRDDLIHQLSTSRGARVAAGALIAAAVTGTLAIAAQDGGGPEFDIIGIVVAFGLGAGGSLLADLDRAKLRMGSALLAGAFFMIALIIRAVFWSPDIGPPLSYVGIPLGGALPFAARAWMHAPPTTFSRVERVLEWAFAGAFWTSLTVVAIAFALKHIEAPKTVARSAVIALGAALIAAVYVHAMIVLDPDGPATAQDEATETADEV
jgi:hypothetical protein